MMLGLVMSARAKGDALLLSAGELSWKMVGAVGQAEAFKLFHCEGAAFLAAYALIEQGEGHVVERVFIADEVERLEHEADHAVTQFGGAILAQILDEDAVEQVFAGIIIVKDTENVQ